MTNDQTPQLLLMSFGRHGLSASAGFVGLSLGVEFDASAALCTVFGSQTCRHKMRLRVGLEQIRAGQLLTEDTRS